MRFGIDMSPLNVSAMLQSSPRFMVAPTIATSAYTIMNGLMSPRSEDKNSIHLVPYSPQPMIVENAKQQSATAVKIDTQPPYAEVNPLMVSSAPATVAVSNRNAAAQDDECGQCTDHDGVDKHFEDTEKPLFYRFSRIGTGMCDRTGSKSCLIGKNTSGNTLFHTHEKASHCSACHGCRVKCTLKNRTEYRWNRI